MRRRTLLTAAAAAGIARPAGAAPARVLIVATSAATAGPGGERTGLDLRAFADAYWLLRRSGLDVRLATIRGGPPPIDPRTGGVTALPVVLRMDVDALAVFREAQPVAAARPADYSAVLLADGYGALHDFPASAPLGALLAGALTAGSPAVAALGRGAAGLLAPAPDGRPLASGRRLTGPTDAEERAAGRAGTGFVPYSLETRLRDVGAAFEAKGVLLENVVRDGALITGQNTESAAAVVRELLAALSGARRAPS